MTLETRWLGLSLRLRDARVSGRRSPDSSFGEIGSGMYLRLLIFLLRARLSIEQGSGHQGSKHSHILH